MRKLYQEMGISPEIYSFGEKILEGLQETFCKIDENAEYNSLKVLHAMQTCRVSEACLLGTTGYGYNDIGRDTLEQVYANIFIRKTHWSDRRSLAEPMPWRWPF